MHNATPLEQTAIVTCSDAPDLERCTRLCRSVDLHVSHSIRHILIVPARDLPKFAQLRGDRREVLAVEAVVSDRFRQVPGLQNLWLDSAGWPLSGRVMRQITKLSANHATSAENILFADSDLEFVRSLDENHLFRQDRLRLQRVPGAGSSAEHQRRHNRAARLLGLEPQYFGADYRGQLITWRREHLQGLQQHLAEVQGGAWERALSRSLHLCGYTLYGAYIDAVVGLRNSRHFGQSRDLCHCCRFDHQARALESGEDRLKSNAIAILIQSNLGLSEHIERRILSRIRLADTRPGGLLRA